MSSSYTTNKMNLTTEFQGTKFVSSKDINYLQGQFEQMQAVTQKSIAKKNQQIAELEAMLEQALKERDQTTRQYADLDHAVSVSTDRIIRSLPPQQQQAFLMQQQQQSQQRTRGSVLVDAVDALLQNNVQENTRMKDATRAVEEANAQLQRELGDTRRCLDEVRNIVVSTSNGSINVGKGDLNGLVAAVKQRLVIEEQITKENEARMRSNLENIRQNSSQQLRKFQADADQLDQRLLSILEARQNAAAQSRQRIQQQSAVKQQQQQRQGSVRNERTVSYYTSSSSTTNAAATPQSSSAYSNNSNRR